MKSRKRVTLGESFRIAGKASTQSVVSGGGGGAMPETGLMATIIFGFWWWLTGVPEDADPPDEVT